MKHCILLAAVCVIAAVFLPLLLFRGASSEALLSVPEIVTAAENSPAPSAPPQESAVTEVERTRIIVTPKPTPASADEAYRFSFRHDGVTEEISMAEYLPGVLAGEMPSAFEKEALRSQAVAARTFVLYHILHGNAKHPDAAVCDDPNCCQVWLSEKERENFDTEKLLSAVRDTDGLYLSYADEPILACFHASSAGYTESVAALWGTALPYLTGVSSPETAEDVPNFVTTVELAPAELGRLVQEAYPEAMLGGKPEEWLGICSRDTSGRVSTLELGGVSIPGTKARSLFSLRSAAFTVEWTGHSFLFTVTGSGHGAGMSQYGANVMAQQGSDYEAILAHYYQGAELVSY